LFSNCSNTMVIFN